MEEAEVVVVSEAEAEAVVTEVTEEVEATLVEEEVAVGALAATVMEATEEGEAEAEVVSGIAEDHPEMTAATLAELAEGVTMMVVITGTTDSEFNTPEYLNIGMHL